MPEVELAVFENYGRAVGAVDSPGVAVALAPYLSDEKNEAVDEAEFGGERQVGLEALAGIARDVAMSGPTTGVTKWI